MHKFTQLHNIYNTIYQQVFQYIFGSSSSSSTFSFPQRTSDCSKFKILFKWCNCCFCFSQFSIRNQLKGIFLRFNTIPPSEWATLIPRKYRSLPRTFILNLDLSKDLSSSIKTLSGPRYHQRKLTTSLVYPPFRWVKKG